MTRYLLDTNIFIYWATDVDLIKKDVFALLREPDALLYLSSASVMEMVVGYNNKSFDTRRWKNAQQMVESINKEFYIGILPFKEEHLLTFARLRANVAKGHKDPFDHMIISHAITEKMTLVSSDQRFPFYRRQGLSLLFNEK
ncbi:MAG: type II toxin-antitoxin system VapC family toxin [Prevotella sp.]|nr:type II toxin-antitoxin system VapC family toxin [Prevotella sp.]MBR3480006.1 type II toxin-antitoxin system VapC family toxin [Prevotella sp.]